MCKLASCLPSSGRIQTASEFLPGYSFILWCNVKSNSSKMSFFFSTCSFPDVLLAISLSSLSVIHGYHWCVWPCERRDSSRAWPQGLWLSFETSVAPPHSAILCAEGGLSHRPGESSQHWRRVNYNVTCTGISRPRPPSEGGRFLSYQDTLQRFSTPTSEWLLLKATEFSQKVSGVLEPLPCMSSTSIATKKGVSLGFAFSVH